MKSWNGYEVVDEKARKDIEKLDINTNIHLDNIEEKYDESLLTKLTAPQTAKVGQIFRVQEVNEDGTLTLEAVDMPSGGAVDDVQIDGKSIVGENGVAEIPTLKRGKFGIPFIDSTDSGRETNGIDVDDRFGNIKVIPSPTWRIDNRATNTVITPKNLDYAVQAAMGAPIGDGMIDGVFHYPAWSEETQAAGRKRMGIYRNFELANAITTTEEISLLTVDTTDSGEAYDYSEVEIIINIPISSSFSINVHFNKKEYFYPCIYFTTGNLSYETFYKIRTIGTGDRVLALATYHTNSDSNGGNIISTSSIKHSNFKGRFTAISFSTSSVIPIGTKIEIYGKR